jgi:hypothetical protein
VFSGRESGANRFVRPVFRMGQKLSDKDDNETEELRKANSSASWDQRAQVKWKMVLAWHLNPAMRS